MSTVVRVRPGTRTSDPVDRLSVVAGIVGRVGATRTRTVTVARSIESGEAVVSARGDVAVTWFQCRGRGAICEHGHAAYVAVMPAGAQRFHAPQLVAADLYLGGVETYYQLVTTFSPTGDLLVVDEDEELTARILTKGGSFGPAQRLGPVHGGQLAAAFIGNGVAVVTASRRNGPGLTVATAVNGSFSRRLTLPTGPGRPETLRLVAAGRHVTVATSRDGTSRITDLSTSDGSVQAHLLAGDLRGAASSRDGAILLVMDPGDGRELHARLRQPGATRFGGLERIADATDVFEVVAEFDPRTDQPVITVQRNVRVARPGTVALLTAHRG